MAVSWHRKQVTPSPRRIELCLDPGLRPGSHRSIFRAAVHRERGVCPGVEVKLAQRIQRIGDHGVAGPDDTGLRDTEATPPRQHAATVIGYQLQW